MVSDVCKDCNALFKFLDAWPSVMPKEFPNKPFQYILSLELAIVNSLPLLIAIGFVITFLIFRKKIYFLWIASIIVALLSNELMFKPMFHQKRPEGSCSNSYGMPSGHSCFSGIFITWALFTYYKKHWTSRVLTWLLVLFGMNNMYGRLYLHYHSLLQILIGFIWGYLCTITILLLFSTEVQLEEEADETKEEAEMLIVKNEQTLSEQV